jgi:hypothetical protein
MYKTPIYTSTPTDSPLSGQRFAWRVEGKFILLAGTGSGILPGERFP